MSHRYGKHVWLVKNAMVELQESDSSKYRSFWGDEFRWTALLPLAWKLIDYPWIEFPERRIEDLDGESGFDAAIALWSAAIHLLSLGMGWSDIEKGLTEWETTGFATGYHPVLDFVKKLCGEEVSLLEFHIQNNRGKYLEIFSQFDEDPSQIDRERPIRELRGIRELASRKPSLGQLLVVGGSDPLHLSTHFRNSVIGDDEFSHDYEIEQHRDEKFVLKLPRYAKWPLQLKNCGAQSTNEIGEFSYGSVEVEIAHLGSIGLFIGGSGRYDRRRFRYTSAYKEIKDGSQFISHYWGL